MPPALIDTSGVLAAALERLNRTTVVSMLQRFATQLDDHCRLLGDRAGQLKTLRDELSPLVATLRANSDQHAAELADLQRQLGALQQRVGSDPASGPQPAAPSDKLAELQQLIAGLQQRLQSLEQAAKDLSAGEKNQVAAALKDVLQRTDQPPLQVNGHTYSAADLLFKLAKRPEVKATEFNFNATDLTSATFVLTSGQRVLFTCQRTDRPELGATEYLFTTQNLEGLPAEFILRFTKTSQKISYCNKTDYLDQYDIAYQSNVVYSFYVC